MTKPRSMTAITLREDQQRVIDALRELPHRQRDCIVLRYYDRARHRTTIATTLGISRNSVKTHLSRGLDALERKLESRDVPEDDSDLVAEGLT